jgi:predicted transcriptional regulator
MYLNKTTTKILQFFTGKMTESFTLREVGRELNMHVSLVHRSIQPLLDNKMIVKDKHELLKLNYNENQENIIFAEYLRRNDLLKKNKELKQFTNEVINKIEEENFVLLLFGSAVNSKKPRDYDILLIIDHKDKIEFHEKFLHNIVSNYNLPFEERVISFESVYEMFAKRDELNVMNEILNKHIILYGAELFYMLVKKGR